MKKNYDNDRDTMREHYDFDYSKAVWGKYYEHLYGKLQLRNPLLRRIVQYYPVDAVADTSSVYLIIPEDMRSKLKLKPIDQREVTLPNGSKTLVPYVGPVEVRLKSHVAFVGALVMGEKVVLGSILFDDMGLTTLSEEGRFDTLLDIPNPYL